MLTTLDFHIHQDEENSYRLEIFERGSSQPLINSSFKYDLSYMSRFEIKQLDVDQKDPSGRLERLQVFGTKLYDTVFTPEVEKLWKEYKEKSDFLVLCLRLESDASGLEVLPWETLYDGEEYISAGATTGLTRLPLEIEIQEDLPALPAPIKMLAFVSSPLDLKENERLQIELEQEILLQAVNDPLGQGKLLIDFEDEAKLPILETSLEADYQIFHYSGHGIPPENGGGLLLEDGQGNKRPTSAPEFLQTIQKGEKELRLAMISGCQTARTVDVAGFRDLARGLVKHKIPAVIAMQFSIIDTAGSLFAETLYPRLIEGQRLDMAVSASRRALLFSDEPLIKADAFAPVLFLSHSQPLQIKGVKAAEEKIKPEIDFSFYLPLPQLSFGFYGRRKEYRAIRDGLLHKNQRAIIVHGIGGIGKTALISHTAHRLKNHFQGVYAFDCRSGVLAPETILLELHRYLEQMGIKALEQLLNQSFPPDQLATFMGQVLSQMPLLIIFDNFETHLNHKEGKRHTISDENLQIFLTTLIKTTAQNSRFLFTSRYLFDVDEKRIGPIQEIPLRDLSRPEALGLMQRLPHLSVASFDDKLKAYDTFGGHPYALVTLDRHCGNKSLKQALENASSVHAELREFLAIELNYASLSEQCRELLNRLAAFRKPVGIDAAEWVMGERVELTMDFIKQVDLKKMPEEMRTMSDEELLSLFQKNLPEQRKAEDLDKYIFELIGWGLLVSLEEDGEMNVLSVHSLVRDFCRYKQRENWNEYLLDAASYYTNITKLLRQDDKTPATVWSEMDAFELLFEAKDFENASSLLISAAPLLYRWGLVRYCESLNNRIIPTVKLETKSLLIHNLGILFQHRGEYDAALAQYEKSLKILEEIGDRAGVAQSMHQIGMIHQNRGEYDAALAQYEKSLKIDEEIGDRAGVAQSLHQIGNIHHDRGEYDAALAQYEKSLKIKEEIGDRAGVAESCGQIGKLFIETNRYPEALENLLTALNIFAKLRSPNLKIVTNFLKELRKTWGAKDFDAAWKEKTGEEVPNELKE